ncbi:MAG: DUF3859 domain-containing protein [Cyanobacteria bacterium J06633_8]
MTTKQVSQIVAEVERLSQRRQSEVEVEELQQILKELNLPDDLLDEAVMQVYRKQALDKEKKRNGLIIAGVLTVVVGAMVATFFMQQQHKSALENIEFSQSRIGFRGNDSVNLKEVERQNTPELFYNVTLQNAPVGKQVELGCNWLKPNREIAHQNSWKTKTIATEVWNTHCRYKLKEDDATGKWFVQMTLNDETKISNQFFVK